MLKISSKPDSNIIVTEASQLVTYRNHPPLAKIIKSKISKHGKVRWLWIGNHFKGWSLKYLIVNSVFDLRHTFYFEKIAIVGNQKRVILMAKLIAPFTIAKVKHFNLEDQKRYTRWIRQ